MPKRYGQSFSDHIDRYSYAMRYCYHKRVLDAGCKDGFGSYLLSQTADLIGLADVSSRDLALAQKNAYNSLTKTYKIDFEKEPLQDEWDVVVAFETIEHLANPDFFLENVKNCLVSGGRFIFSVPHMSPAKLHKQLYDEEKIRALIGKYFTLDEFYIQNSKSVTGAPLFHNIKVYVGLATK